MPRLSVLADYPSAPNDCHIGVRLNASVLAFVDTKARDLGISRSDCVRRALVDGLTSQEVETHPSDHEGAR